MTGHEMRAILSDDAIAKLMVRPAHYLPLTPDPVTGRATMPPSRPLDQPPRKSVASSECPPEPDRELDRIVNQLENATQRLDTTTKNLESRLKTTLRGADPSEDSPSCDDYATLLSRAISERIIRISRSIEQINDIIDRCELPVSVIDPNGPGQPG